MVALYRLVHNENVNKKIITSVGLLRFIEVIKTLLLTFQEVFSVFLVRIRLKLTIFIFEQWYTENTYCYGTKISK